MGGRTLWAHQSASLYTRGSRTVSAGSLVSKSGVFFPTWRFSTLHWGAMASKVMWGMFVCERVWRFLRPVFVHSNQVYGTATDAMMLNGETHVTHSIGSRSGKAIPAPFRDHLHSRRGWLKSLLTLTRWTRNKRHARNSASQSKRMNQNLQNRSISPNQPSLGARRFHDLDYEGAEDARFVTPVRSSSGSIDVEGGPIDSPSSPWPEDSYGSAKDVKDRTWPWDDYEEEEPERDTASESEGEDGEDGEDGEGDVSDEMEEPDTLRMSESGDAEQRDGTRRNLETDGESDKAWEMGMRNALGWSVQWCCHVPSLITWNLALLATANHEPHSCCMLVPNSQRLCQAIKHEDPGMTPTFICHTPHLPDIWLCAKVILEAPRTKS